MDIDSRAPHCAERTLTAPLLASAHIRAQTSRSGKAARSQPEPPPPIEPTDIFFFFLFPRLEGRPARASFLSATLSARLTVELRLRCALHQRQRGENKTTTRREKPCWGSFTAAERGFFSLALSLPASEQKPSKPCRR